MGVEQDRHMELRDINYYIQKNPAKIYSPGQENKVITL